MKNRTAVLGVGLCLVLLGPVNQGLAAEIQLHIPPLFQERPSWCWAAVGEMVFKYYYVPAAHRTDYQCGIAQGRNLCKDTPNCLECDLPAGDEAVMVNMLERYPSAVAPGSAAGEVALTAQLKTGSLSEAEVKKELDENRPVIVGLSPSGFKVDGNRQHMALIVGYDDSSEHLTLTVNDPFPFEDDRFLWIGTPYPGAHASGGSDGQYEIEYETFLRKLKWTSTIYRLTCTGRGCPSDNHQVAHGAVAKDDRAAIQSVLTASSDDFQTLRRGHKAVDADRATTWQSTVTFSGANQCLVRDKDHHGGARWNCTFKFADREDAEKAIPDIVSRVRKSLPEGWTGTDLDEDTDSEFHVTTQKFSARKPGTASTMRVYLTDIKKNGRVTIYLSVDNS